MSIVNQVQSGGIVGVIIAITLIFLISPAMLYFGFWLLGMTLATTLKIYAGLIVLTLWLIFMTHFT